MARAIRTTPSLLTVRLITPLIVLLGGLALSSCENTPYRVEWGFKKDFEKRDAEGAPPVNVAPVTLKEAWIVWQTRHDKLVRRVSDRAPGAAFPMATLKKTVVSLRGIRRHYPEHETLIAEVAADYEHIGTQLPRLAGAVAAHRLGKVADKLKTVAVSD